MATQEAQPTVTRTCKCCGNEWEGPRGTSSNSAISNYFHCRMNCDARMPCNRSPRQEKED